MFCCHFWACFIFYLLHSHFYFTHLITSCTSHVIHAPSYFCIPLLFFLIKFHLFLKKIKFENYKYYKNLKMIFFTLWYLFGRPHRVTTIFKKYKNSFLSLLLSVRPLASCDIYFQVIQKIQKKYKVLKKLKISTPLQTNIF